MEVVADENIIPNSMIKKKKPIFLSNLFYFWAITLIEHIKKYSAYKANKKKKNWKFEDLRIRSLLNILKRLVYKKNGYNAGNYKKEGNYNEYGRKFQILTKTI